MKEMNPKKGFCNLFLCFIIFCIVAGCGSLAKFGNRIPSVEQQIKENAKLYEDQYETGDNESKDLKDNKKHEFSHEIELKNIIKFTTGDYIFLGVMAVVFWIILCIYWLYSTAYVVTKANEAGTNKWLFGILTLMTNIFGMVCLWIFIRLHNVCPSCGKLQSKKANNCSYCGTTIYINCPECERRISIKDKYCNGCGHKIIG